jgi:hypothetical protein
MTDQPPPPPGNYPPPPPPPPGGGYPPPPPPGGGYPPPPGGGYPPPPPQGGGFPPPPGAPVAALPKEAYTSWGTRVGYLIDYIPYAIIVGIGYGIEAATQEAACVTDTSEYSLGDLRTDTPHPGPHSSSPSWSALHTWCGTSATGRHHGLEHRQVDHEVRSSARSPGSQSVSACPWCASSAT